MNDSVLVLFRELVNQLQLLRHRSIFNLNGCHAVNSINNDIANLQSDFSDATAPLNDAIESGVKTGLEVAQEATVVSTAVIGPAASLCS